MRDGDSRVYVHRFYRENAGGQLKRNQKIVGFFAENQTEDMNEPEAIMDFQVLGEVLQTQITYADDWSCANIMKSSYTKFMHAFNNAGK